MTLFSGYTKEILCHRLVWRKKKQRHPRMIQFQRQRELPGPKQFDSGSVK
jgi:hypothetical protein